MERGGIIMETQIYKVRDPSGALREIRGPAGATDDQVIAKAKELFGGQSTESSDQPTEPQQRTRGYGEELGRQLGLTARHGLKGLTAIPAMIGDAIGMNSSGSVNTLADMIGLPKPESRLEKIVGTGTEAVASGGGMLGLGTKMAQGASPMVKAAGDFLSMNPTSQLALSGVSGTAAESAKQSGASEGGQLAAGIGAPIAASLIAPIASRTAAIPYNLVAPMFSKDAANTGAARMLNDITGKRAGVVANAMTQTDPMQTGGQASLGTGSAEMQAAQKLLRQRRPSEYSEVDSAQKWDWRQQWKNLNKNTEAIRTKALDDANYGGVKADAITNEIDSILSTAGSGRASKVVEGALNEVKSRIGRFTDNTSGLIDSKDLYDIRKKIGTTIKNYSKENSDWDKQLSSGLERDIQKAIDKEIIGAGGGSNWTTYLSEYSKEAKRLMEIKDAAKRAKSLASAGTPETRVLMNQSENPIEGVNLLSRPITVLNALLKRSEMAGGRQVEQAAADLLKPQSMGGDPRQLGLLMMEQAKKPSVLQNMRSGLMTTPQASFYGLLNARE